VLSPFGFGVLFREYVLFFVNLVYELFGYSALYIFDIIYLLTFDKKNNSIKVILEKKNKKKNMLGNIVTRQKPCKETL